MCPLVSWKWSCTWRNTKDRDETNNAFSQFQNLKQGPNEHFNTLYVKYQEYAVYEQMHEQVGVHQLTSKLNLR
jgi:hypothetical protein